MEEKEEPVKGSGGGAVVEKEEKQTNTGSEGSRKSKASKGPNGNGENRESVGRDRCGENARENEGRGRLRRQLPKVGVEVDAEGAGESRPCGAENAEDEDRHKRSVA